MSDDSKSETKRLLFYSLICILLPLLILGLFLIFSYQRTQEISQTYIQSGRFGLFDMHYDEKFYRDIKISTGAELVIKTITFFLFLGSCFMIWRKTRDFETGELRVEEETFLTKLGSKMRTTIRKIILGIMIFGSLIFNYLIFFTSGYEMGIMLCKLNPNYLYFISLQEHFELLKRLNGVYLLIFIATGEQFRKAIKKSRWNCCKNCCKGYESEDLNMQTIVTEN